MKACSVKYGAMSLIPNVTPVFVGFGVWAIFRGQINTGMVIVFGMTLGIVVDDTVHFMHHFRRYLAKGCSVEESIRNTLHTSGRAMLVTSLVLCSGFIIMIFSAMNNLTNFGIYTGLIVALALMADFLLAPALMVLFVKRD